MRRIIYLVILLYVCAAACAGCKSSEVKQETPDNTGGAAAGGTRSGKDPAGSSNSTEAVPAPSYYTHVVKWSGETSSIIAAWYTGDRMNWEILAKHNPSIDPAKIHAGMKILIPDSVMKTKAPMTKEFVNSFYHLRKRRSQKEVREDKENSGEYDTQIFGPKDPMVNVHGQGANEYP